MIRVVLADDDRLMTFILRGQLDVHDYEVVGVAANGAEAVALCLDKKPEVVLMDVQMPKMDGIEATRLIMKNAPTCIIMVSANNTRSSVEAAMNAGASAFLVKPILKRQLLETIEQAIKQFRGKLK